MEMKFYDFTIRELRGGVHSVFDYGKFLKNDTTVRVCIPRIEGASGF